MAVVSADSLAGGSDKRADSVYTVALQAEGDTALGRRKLWEQCCKIGGRSRLLEGVSLLQSFDSESKKIKYTGLKLIQKYDIPREFGLVLLGEICSKI